MFLDIESCLAILRPETPALYKPIIVVLSIPLTIFLVPPYREYIKWLTFQRAIEEKWLTFRLAFAIEETIVASHIHRITDIDNSTTMTEEEKNIAAIDSDNGFWLCANHDKMFENGLFYFLDDKLIISNDIKGLVDRTEKYAEKSISNIKDGILQNNIRALVYRMSDELVLKNFKIEPIHYTPKMHDYLEIHRHRVKGF